MGGKGGGGGGNTQTIQKADPWAGIQPYLTDLYKEASGVYRQGPQQYYPMQTFSGFRPEELIGQQTGLNTAFRQLPRIADQANTALGYSLSPGILSPGSNPYLAQHARGMISPITEALTEQILPQIGRAATGAGQDRGSSRSQLAQGLAVDRAVEDMLQATSGLYSGAYGQGLQQMTRGMQLAPQMAGLSLVPSQTLMNIGAQRRGMDQAAIDEAKARYEYGEQAPYQNLQQYSGILQPYANVGGTSSTSEKAGGGSPLMGALGGALAGYQLGNMFMGGFGGGGGGFPWPLSV